MTNNYSILFSITNTISVTYGQLLLTYLVPKHNLLYMNKRVDCYDITSIK